MRVKLQRLKCERKMFGTACTDTKCAHWTTDSVGRYRDQGYSGKCDGQRKLDAMGRAHTEIREDPRRRSGSADSMSRARCFCAVADKPRASFVETADETMSGHKSG